MKLPFPKPSVRVDDPMASSQDVVSLPEHRFGEDAELREDEWDGTDLRGGWAIRCRTKVVTESSPSPTAHREAETAKAHRG